jgi:chromate transporter
MIISLFFEEFMALEYVSRAFKGIQICVVYLILSAGLRMLKKMKKTAFNIIVISVVLILEVLFTLFSVNFSTIYFILISGTLCVVVNFITSTTSSVKGEK